MTGFGAVAAPSLLSRLIPLRIPFEIPQCIMNEIFDKIKALLGEHGNEEESV